MTEEGGSQRVKYDTKNHFTVLTQMHGSVWPAVMPHCILNTLNICGIIYLDRYRGIDISYSDKGHTFMSMIVSFLVVTRSSIAYSRFMESRSHLATVMKSCRELIQYAVTFTRYDTTETTTKWRYSLARKTIVLLRSVVSVLEFETTGEHVWKNKVLDKREKRALTDAVGEDNFRSPMILAMFLRTTIASNVEFMDEPLHVSRELRLYSFVSEFVTGYHGLTKLIDTQFPFPLAQMTATFVFIWVYSLPAVLYNDDIAIPSLILIVFFITYGKLCFTL
jgi:predicted membrane chloride channel (bestrophin family)